MATVIITGEARRQFNGLPRAIQGRRLIKDRRAAGLSQQELAKLAGVRQETISRIESGKHTATVRVIDTLDKALRKAKRKHSAKPRWRG